MTGESTEESPGANTAALPSIPAPTDEVDDADALPAVGKVWDTGPKRSLSEILASAQREQQQQQATAPPPAQRSANAAVPADLAALWSATTQQVQETLGASIHVPLMSGEPRREGDQITVRFSGAFATMARYLEKAREQIRQIISTIAGQELALRFEADETGPTRAPAAAHAPQPASRPVPPATNPSLAAVAPPVREGIPLTPELRAQLEKDALIRAIMEQFNGNIVKVEEA